jgi:2-succinyl-5-enolpyruvyl-6-hydroxy-3-cyclohexene-1-carboxylate synthase
MRTQGQLNINHFFDGLHFLGMRHIVICPGSRNAPLIHGAVQQGEFQLRSVVDERSAAYQALGIAQITRRPVGLICTSGTALLNFFPAIAEAHHLRVPLVVMSADRPEQLRHKWENQSIHQVRVFGSYVNTYLEWKGILETKRALGKVERCLQKAWDSLHFPDSGPVHVNFCFSEPLYFSDVRKPTAPFGLKTRSVAFTPPSFSPPPSPLPASDMLVLCGQGRYVKSVEEALIQWQQKGAIILCDLLSPYRHLQWSKQWETAFSSPQTPWEQIRPHTLVTTGTYVLNKKIKEWLRANPPSQHVHMADTHVVRDVYNTRPVVTQKPLLTIDFKGNSHSFQQAWEQMKQRTADKITETIGVGQSMFSEWSVVCRLLSLLHKDMVLHMANSMSVRYVASIGPAADITCFANRGTGGIDGCVSTAIGAAVADPQRQHVLLCGDLAFFYDTNGFWPTTPPSNLLIVMLNNRGGRIFDMIPGPSQSLQPELFITPHHLRAEGLCQTFGIAYQKMESLQEWEQHEHALFSGHQCCVIEIITQNKDNIFVWNNLKT